MSPVPDDLSELRRRELDERLERSPIARGQSSLHRPDELIVEHWAERLLAETIEREHGGAKFGARDDHWRNQVGLPEEGGDLNGRLEKAQLSLWTLPAGSNLQEVVARLRARLDAAPTRPEDPDRPRQAGVSLNQVYIGEGVYQGGPGGAPFKIEPLELSADRPPLGVGPGLAVLDTGLPDNFESLHPNLAPALAPDPTNFKPPVFTLQGRLASQSGHGIFISGLVHRVATTLAIDPGRVLDPTGAGDDATVTAELSETEAPVISLSLGGYTDDDRPPLGLMSVIDDLVAGGRVVVAAAGNNASPRPFWPAAGKGVLAVGAYDSTGETPKPATFSNFGPWVDVWAPGHRLLSTYVEGRWLLDAEHHIDFEKWAGWSGTSFAAPLVAAEIARRVAGAADPRSARRVAMQFLAELDQVPWTAESFPHPDTPVAPLAFGHGLLYRPPVDLTR